ncbi:hypothetical protein ACF07V_04475 [Streptomyces sp. NPDC015661]|uniref:hypothetical protein n=1 Tax=Streptomyces sp. NPDC015661 TaxID=3364961 RepID=UPI0036F9A953
MGGPGEQVQGPQAVVRGQQVDVLQRPVLLASLLARHLRLGLSDPRRQVLLTLPRP